MTGLNIVIFKNANSFAPYNCQHLLYAYCVPGTMWDDLHILLHLFQEHEIGISSFNSWRNCGSIELGTQLPSAGCAGACMQWACLADGPLRHSALLPVLRQCPANSPPLPELGAQSETQAEVLFPAASPNFLLQITHLCSCYLWPIVCYPGAACSWSCQHARKHLAGKRERKKVQYVCVASYLKWANYLKL